MNIFLVLSRPEYYSNQKYGWQSPVVRTTDKVTKWVRGYSLGKWYMYVFRPEDTKHTFLHHMATTQQLMQSCLFLLCHFQLAL